MANLLVLDISKDDHPSLGFHGGNGVSASKNDNTQRDLGCNKLMPKNLDGAILTLVVSVKVFLHNCLHVIMAKQFTTRKLLSGLLVVKWCVVS